MNREIKFRGKMLHNGEWCYGFIYRHDPPLQVFASERKEVGVFSILRTGFADWNMPRPIEQNEVDGETVGQFTHLKDKNEKEIYEDDIVQPYNYRGGKLTHLWVVKYDMYDGYFNIETGKERHGGMPLNGGLHNFKLIEVVGNIHDNPELL